jgi:hypothetical protein
MLGWRWVGSNSTRCNLFYWLMLSYDQRLWYRSVLLSEKFVFCALVTFYLRQVKVVMMSGEAINLAQTRLLIGNGSMIAWECCFMVELGSNRTCSVKSCQSFIVIRVLNSWKRKMNFFLKCQDRLNTTMLKPLLGLLYLIVRDREHSFVQILRL